MKERVKIFKCECGGDKYILLPVIDVEDGNFEIDGGYLKSKSVKRLIKFLSSRKKNNLEG